MPSSDCNSSMVSCIATGQGPRVQGDNVILSLIELTPIPGKQEEEKRSPSSCGFIGDRVTGRPGDLSFPESTKQVIRSTFCIWNDGNRRKRCIAIFSRVFIGES